MKRDAGDDPGFLDDYVSTGLDAAVPRLVDFVCHQADVATAFWALAGLGLGYGGVTVVANEAGNVVSRLRRFEKLSKERLGRRLDGSLSEKWAGFCSLRGRFGFRVCIFARGSQAGDRTIPDHAFPLAHLEIRMASPT